MWRKKQDHKTEWAGPQEENWYHSEDGTMKQEMAEEGKKHQK